MVQSNDGRVGVADTSFLQNVASLSRGVLLEVFGQNDRKQRLEAIKRIFAEDVTFIDHNGTYRGRSEIDHAVERLHARFPEFRFAHTSEPQMIDGAARLNWKFGPPSDPAKITGTDMIVVQNGQVSLLLVFLDP